MTGIFDDDYYRDSTCEEIEQYIREYPQFGGWTVRRIRTDTYTSDIGDKYVIQDAKGNHMTDLYEHEIKLLMNSDMFLSALDMTQQTRIFRRIGIRGFFVVMALVIIIPFLIMIPITNYITSLPQEQVFVGFMVLFGLVFGLFGVIAFFGRRSERIDFAGDARTRPYEGTGKDLLTPLLDQYDDLKELRETDPDEYMRRIEAHIDDTSEESDEIEDSEL